MKQDIEKGEERIPGRWNHFPVFDWGREGLPFSPPFSVVCQRKTTPQSLCVCTNRCKRSCFKHIVSCVGVRMCPKETLRTNGCSQFWCKQTHDCFCWRFDSPAPPIDWQLKLAQMTARCLNHLTKKRMPGPRRLGTKPKGKRHPECVCIVFWGRTCPDRCRSWAARPNWRRRQRPEWVGVLLVCAAAPLVAPFYLWKTTSSEVTWTSGPNS
jgi:hypothetical protein